jgi:hypothetical protein
LQSPLDLSWSAALRPFLMFRDPMITW